ncbi:MAG: molybdopterin-guanine dinucleotide biosynthesis protein MobB, partial [Gammaproteobacteria bacterium]|nr:molybdopterin-guanine dinucleotide biosynthesis protein MobB [Gammaproteobacteria bacterium]
MSRHTNLPPVIGFSAFSGTGKTTLLKKIIVLLRERDIRLAVIKHAHHDFEIDHPGKDSFELRKADAYQMLISSGKRTA